MPQLEQGSLSDEVYNICLNEKLCPYEVTRILAKYADVVIGNYNYILVEVVRESVLGKAGIRVENVNCALMKLIACHIMRPESSQMNSH